MTVFDTGAGLARKWWTKHHADSGALTTQDEETFIRQCFALHNTTKNIPGSGAGLTATLQYLRRMKAFMLLRTGRLLQYQDFSQGSEEFRPSNWQGRPPPLAESPGAVYTLAIPISTIR
jgi:hypothetical protein